MSDAPEGLTRNESADEMLRWFWNNGPSRDYGRCDECGMDRQYQEHVLSLIRSLRAQRDALLEAAKFAEGCIFPATAPEMRDQAADDELALLLLRDAIKECDDA